MVLLPNKEELLAQPVHLAQLAHLEQLAQVEQQVQVEHQDMEDLITHHIEVLEINER